MFLVFHFGLVNLFAILFVSLGGFLLEVGPLVVHFVQLFLKTLNFNFPFVELVFGVTQLQFEFCDMVVVRVQNGLLLLTKGSNESIMPLFSVFGFLS